MKQSFKKEIDTLSLPLSETAKQAEVETRKNETRYYQAVLWFLYFSLMDWLLCV